MCLNHMSTKAKLLLLYEGGYFVSLRCKDTSFSPFKSHHCKVKSIYRGFLQVNEGFKPLNFLETLPNCHTFASAAAKTISRLKYFGIVFLVNVLYKAYFVSSRCKPRRFMMQTPEVLGAY